MYKTSVHTSVNAWQRERTDTSKTAKIMNGDSEIRKQHLANVKRSAHMSLRERNRVWIFQSSLLFLGRVLDSTLSWICHGFDIF